MQAIGVYVSDLHSPQEIDRAFAEPGLFVVNAEGLIQMVDVSNAPFLRVDRQSALNGTTFIRKKMAIRSAARTKWHDPRSISGAMNGAC